MPKPVNRNISTTFLKGIEVLKAFDDNNTHVTQADMAARTGLDRAGVVKGVKVEVSGGIETSGVEPRAVGAAVAALEVLGSNSTA